MKPMKIMQYLNESDKYDLVGIDGNAFNIMGYVGKAMKECGFSADEIKAYHEEAKSGDYDNLIQVSMKYIDRCNDIASPKKAEPVKEKKSTSRVDWDYFDKFNKVTDKYLPGSGEGETMATQIVTAITKLVYKWYNDGDVYDNVNSRMEGWANDLSDYANWLAENVDGAKEILDEIFELSYNDEAGYETILKDLADNFMTEEFLSTCESVEKTGSIYNCSGSYEFNDSPEEDEEWEEDYYDDDEEEDYE